MTAPRRMGTRAFSVGRHTLLNSAARSFFFFFASASAQHSTNASAASATRLLIIIEKFFGESMVTCTEYKFGEAQLLAGVRY